MTRNRIILSTFALCLMGSPMGCTEPEEDNHDTNHDHNNHDHNNDHKNNHDGEEHVCVHFESGPEVDVTAIGDAAGTLPETFQEHTRIDVTMPADADTAYVQWTSEEAGEFIFWMSEDVPVVLIDAGTEIMPEESGGAAMGCETLAKAHKTFDVEAKAYVLKIGPATAGATVQFSAEHAGEHGEHSE